MIFFVSLALPVVFSQSKYEGKQIERVFVTFGENGFDSSASEQFRLIVENAIGDKYSTVKIRDALAKLYETKRIISAKVQAEKLVENKVFLRFILQRKKLAKKISIRVGNVFGDPVTEQELLLRLNLLSPGSTITEIILQENANVILTYLRERGFFGAEVSFEQKSLGNWIDVEVLFKVNPNTQAKVKDFKIDIDNFDASSVRTKLNLSSGTLFSRQKLDGDLGKIRFALLEKNYLAPRLNEPRVVYDSDENTISINLSGEIGAIINVSVDTEKEKVNEKTQRRLLPVKREGTIDYSAIVEGQRRLESYYQEKGYFFARVTPYCSVNPQFEEGEASETKNDTEILCTALSIYNLTGRDIQLRYEVDLNRKLRLSNIRIEGTDKLNITEIQSVLASKKASYLGFIPILGYGQGYTSLEMLKKDRSTIRALMRELGYRNTRVGVKQGVSLEGADLIITFVVKEGIPTIIEKVDIEGNTSFSHAKIRAVLPNLVGKNFSRARARNGLGKIVKFYRTHGYYDTKVSFSIVEYPKNDNAKQEKIKLVYKLRDERKKVFVNRVLINGLEKTKQEAVLRTIDLKPESVLRITDIFSSEQNLYATDAFERVEIKTETAGETADGQNLQADLIINLEEKKPRLITHGGGYSTDLGISGFFDIRHFNLFGKLQQGGVQVRWSQRQQLFQFDFLSPRFIIDGKDEDGRKRFAPLTFTAQYQRDSTVTRFFRSTFDQGTFGIVQRTDNRGKPIDEFGNAAGNPTINRFTLSAETSRTLSKKNRSILFIKYRFQDVRLFDFESLLVRDLLRPDAKMRISGFGATFARDTRKNCSIKNTLLEIISKGEPGDPCRYNAGDPTKGGYLTAEYSVSVPALGANIGFNKLQINYNRYHTFPKLKNTTFAGRLVLGVANVFSNGNRFSPSRFSGLNGSLPISERFFAGGATTLRGFDFEEAGPRIAFVPRGIFRDQKGNVVSLKPFTIPFGGNASALVNIEARVPISSTIRAVLFYDGGNVFRRFGEIFNPVKAPENNVFLSNLRSVWSHTVGLGFRLKTPIGGELAVDYGYLPKPPRFLIPRQKLPNTTFQLRRGQIHFRFSHAF